MPSLSVEIFSTLAISFIMEVASQDAAEIHLALHSLFQEILYNLREPPLKLSGYFVLFMTPLPLSEWQEKNNLSMEKKTDQYKMNITIISVMLRFTNNFF